MVEKTELQLKLKDLRLYLGYKNQTSFAKKLGISQAAIANMEGGKRDVSKPVILKIKEVFNIDLISWTSNNNMPEQHKKSENIISIPYHDIGAAAGVGTWLGDEPAQNTMVFDKRFLNQILRTDNYSRLHIIFARGDSMDSGWNQPDDIKDGDLLMVDTSQTTGNNQIFVILVNNSELRVKRLFKRGDALYISSNNSKYKEEVYYPDSADFEVKVIGRVIWNGSKENV